MNDIWMPSCGQDNLDIWKVSLGAGVMLSRLFGNKHAPMYHGYDRQAHWQKWVNWVNYHICEKFSQEQGVMLCQLRACVLS